MKGVTLQEVQTKPMGLAESSLLFGIPTVVFYVITRVLIPYFNRTHTIHPILTWFMFGGLFLFVPLFVLAIMLFRKDGYDFDLMTLAARFRLVRLTRSDWLWFVGAVIAIMVLNGIIMAVWKLLSVRFGINPMDTSAPFLHFDPLRGSARLLLFIWLPFFFFNIVGEELLWRGYILPRQEAYFGKFAWLVNAVLWLIFHICFGFDLLVLLLPVLLILPYVVQRRRNTWIGIMIHAVVNGPSFVAISLGLI